jgi:hypothetical protein
MDKVGQDAQGECASTVWLGRISSDFYSLATTIVVKLHNEVREKICRVANVVNKIAEGRMQKGRRRKAERRRQEAERNN